VKNKFFIIFSILATFSSVLNAQNYAIDFDGSNDHITTTIDADLQVMPSTTWSGWIKPNGAAGWQVIFGMEDGGWDRFLIIENGGLNLSMGHTNGRWNTGVSINTGAWQHVVAIYDNGAMRFYFNGTEYTTNQNEGNHSSSGKFTIGGNQTHSPHNYYGGQIDEVAVWNEALSANEISALYNSGAGLDASSNSGDYISSSNLVGYFKMNEGSGTTISDSSGNGASGTLNNMNASSDWVEGGISVVNTDILITSSTVSENITIGTIVGNFSSSGMAENVSLTYSLNNSGNASDDDNDSFTISGTTLLTSTTLDYETKTSYNIYINVNDGSSNYAKAFTVSVTNVNEAPTDISFEAPGVNVEY
jgi:hypothetical protein